MFGHGVFDIPMKTQFRGEGEDTDWWNETMPVSDDYDDAELFDAAFDSAKKKREQMIGVLEGIFSQDVSYYADKGIGWCFQSGFGPYVYWKLYEKDEDGNWVEPYEAVAAYGKEVATLLDEDNIVHALEFLAAQDDILIWRDSCDDLGIEHESFDYGPSGGSGDAGDSDEDEEEPEDPSSLKPYYLPIVLILAGGAAYYYKDQLIQVSKRIM